jgi:hypothetical protein
MSGGDTQAHDSSCEYLGEYLVQCIKDGSSAARRDIRIKNDVHEPRFRVLRCTLNYNGPVKTLQERPGKNKPIFLA